jgi:hypothetical protein
VDLEDELKRLFQDERLDVQVAADAEQSVVAGARRVRRRRAMLLTAAGALTAVVLAASGVALTRPASETTDAIAGQPPSLPITSDTTPSPTSSLATEPAPPSGDSITSKVGPPAPPSNSPGTPRSTTSKPSSTVPTLPSTALPAGQRIGPTSYGKIKLGMTQTELAATGSVDAGVTTGACTRYQIKSGGTVLASTTNGVVDINPNVTTTQEDITIGSTIESAKAKYPDFTGTSGDSVKVPGNSAAVYVFTVSAGKVTGIRLKSSISDC